MATSPICVDASIVVRLVADPHDTRVPALWDAREENGAAIIAPTLLMYEVVNALYRYQRAMMLSAGAVELALQAAQTLPIQLHGDANLHREALALAGNLGLPAAYDAHYLALAARHGATLWTADARLANAVGGKLTWVQVVPTS